MRELKFRAWDGRTVIYDVVPTCEEEIAVLSEYDWTTRSVIVEQYTGLKDKNGKEIYEGDIVTLCGEWEEIEHDDCCIVTFENGCFRVGDGYENEAGHYLSDWRIIGNIHENPELLEDEE